MREQLEELCSLYGVDTAFHDAFGHYQQVSNDTLIHVLRSLDCPIESEGDIAFLIRQRRRSLLRRCVEPVVVIWLTDENISSGRVDWALPIRVPPGSGSSLVRVTLRLEDGHIFDFEHDLQTLSPYRHLTEDGEHVSEYHLPMQSELSMGYHDLRVACDGHMHLSRVIAAPMCMAQLPERTWGVFAPTYALHSMSAASPSLSDLERLANWSEGLGGSIIGTLPMLATFLDSPFEPSPYSPVSKMFWNELFLDVERAKSGEALSLVPAKLDSASSSSYVDYGALYSQRRSAIAGLATRFFAENLSDEFESYKNARPHASDYARFRAVTAALGRPWQTWPEAMRNGDLREAAYDTGEYHFHLYAQFEMAQQLESFSARRARGQIVYLDFPLGVHPDGYDRWRWKDEFLDDFNTGAPPDPLQLKGQEWGFASPHPERMRENGYQYFRLCIAEHMRYANLLRIDHVMGLHRVFCIPKGQEPAQGTYVRQYANELYAVLAVESRRASCAIIGEDLGTVPDGVRESMNSHGVHRMHVIQFGLRPEVHAPLETIAPDSVVYVNTHDMWPWAGFLDGKDLDFRHQAGTLPEPGYEHEKRARNVLKEALHAFGMLRLNDPKRPLSEVALEAILDQAAKQQGHWLVLNLEDLWLDPQPQNIPGTLEPTNWRHRTFYSLEELEQLRTLSDYVQRIGASWTRIR